MWVGRGAIVFFRRVSWDVCESGWGDCTMEGAGILD